MAILYVIQFKQNTENQTITEFPDSLKGLGFIKFLQDSFLDTRMVTLDANHLVKTRMIYFSSLEEYTLWYEYNRVPRALIDQMKNWTDTNNVTLHEAVHELPEMQGISTIFNP